MSAHAPAAHGHASHGSNNSILTEAQAWFATNSPSKLNPLSATDKVGHNLLSIGIVKNTTAAIADVFNPFWTALKNAGSLVSPAAYREHGLKNVPKSISGTLSHVATSASNLIGSFTRGTDHAWTHGVTNNLVDIASGTTDRVPVIGKPVGNIVKAANVIIAAPLRGLAWLQKNTLDWVTDKWNSVATEKGPARHLTVGGAHAAAGHDAGHH